MKPTQQNDGPGDERGPTPAEAEALQWVIRCDRGLTADQRREFAEWKEDPQNARLWEEFRGTWGMIVPERSTPGRAASGPRWRVAAVAFAASVALLLGFLAWTPPGESPQAITTQAGELRILNLPDGTRITLNADSRIQVRYTPAARRVWLEQGHSHFEVAKDPARPFVVVARGVDVRAVGTAFDVRLGSQGVDVLVTEGVVAVAREENRADAVLVAAGHRAVVTVDRVQPPRAVNVTALAREELEKDVAWRERRVEFVSAPLREIVAEFNRHNRHQLVIEDPVLAEREFGGAFRTSDQAGFLRLLRDSFGITVETRGEQTILRP